MTRRGLVIGYGSIGERHSRVLETLDFTVSVVSRRRQGGGRPVFATVPEACSTGSFDHAVVADETERHLMTLSQLAMSGHDGFVLVEKPLFASRAPVPRHRFRGASVGYNLRFHPVVRALRKALAGRSAQMANFYVGQDLTDWRVGREPAKTYSAVRAAGGGVLRDLSHELDLATWLFGSWQRVTAIGGRLGDVTVDADDGWGILLSCVNCPVITLELNGLDRNGRRTIIVQTDGETLRVDLVASTLEIGRNKPQCFAVERDETYADMHRALFKGSVDICTLDDGARVVDLIEAIEQATSKQCWIERSAA
jgi:predicted dehydrogenase